MVGEDGLCCALGERLVQQALPGWSLARASINTGGITKFLPALVRYAQQAQHVQPVLCVADTDMSCAVQLKNQWMPANSTDDFLLRFAVSEAESWLLADREAIALFFGIAEANVPRNPDSLDDPKLEILRLAKRSSGMLRREMISPNDLQKPGTGYNVHLQKFAREKWRPIVARHHSESLNRALLDVARLDRVTNH